ncbi:MAG: amidohydrolase family protein [Bacteroidota bacterium]
MKEPKRKCRYLILMLWLLSLNSTIHGQEIDLEPVTDTYAIRNANIVQSPGRVISMGAVLIEEGVIKSVGKSINIPANAKIIEADSMYIYAGFIDGLSHIGLPKPKEKAIDRSQIKDPANPPNDLSGIQPERLASAMLGPKDKSVSDMRKIGFTTAQAVPHGLMLPGQGTLILLSGETPDQMVYRKETSMYAQLEGAPRRLYPNTVIGVMAKYRELYRQAVQSKDYLKKYNANPAGMVRPEQNFIEEAFYPVIEKKTPVTFRAESVLDIQRALTLKSDLGFDLMLGEVKQGWDVIDKIKASNAKVFLSLDLPEIKEEKQDSEKDKVSASKTESDLEKERLEKRKKEIIDLHYQQASTFKDKGLKFGFSTLEVKPKDIKKNLSKLLEYGMTESDLIAALTTHPAELLGLSTVMGTIDPGKMANLVVTDKPYFDEKSNVRYVIVDGNVQSYEVKKPKKKGTGKDAMPKGKWSYSADTPNGTVTGEIIITGEPDDYSGTISNSQTGQTTDLTEVSVGGGSLSLSFPFDIGGNNIQIQITAEIDGNTFEGNMSVGQLGSFEVEGQREPKN